MTRRTGYRKDSPKLLTPDRLVKMIEVHHKDGLTWQELAFGAGCSVGHLLNCLNEYRRGQRDALKIMFRQGRTAAEIEAAFDQYLASY
jgi:hypothetical protein